MHASNALSGVSPADRLGVTGFFSVVAHLILILGVTFAQEDPPERRVASLDVVLAPWRSEAAPDRPDYLSQASRDGGGDDAGGARPSTPGPVPFSAGGPTGAALAFPAPAPLEPPSAPPPSEAEALPVEPARPLAKLRLEADAIQPRSNGQAPRSEPEKTTETSRAPEVDAATSRRLAMAALSAEIERKLQAYAERPRRKWISARTREHKFAAYMDAWRRRIERIGNLNYPDEAARRGLSGDLLLDVALNPDGTVENITLRRSSGEPVLDAAALRIVQLAAPFPEFPEDVAKEVDVLHIERTWVFLSDDRFGSQ